MSNDKKISTKKDYLALLKSGMFWEFYPELTGDWDDDKKIVLGNTKTENTPDHVEHSCPECGSSRILEAKDYTQCRLCWNVWK